MVLPAANDSLPAVRSRLHSCVSADKDIPFHRITIAGWLRSAAMAAGISFLQYLFARIIPSFCAGTIICGKQYNITHDDMPYTFFAIIILLQQKKLNNVCTAALLLLIVHSRRYIVQRCFCNTYVYGCMLLSC